jgi:hypothetical protein
MRSISFFLFLILYFNSIYGQKRLDFDKSNLHPDDSLVELEIRMDGGYKSKYMTEGLICYVMFYYFYDNGGYCNFGVQDMKNKPKVLLDKDTCYIYPIIRDDYSYWGFINLDSDTIVSNCIQQKGLIKKKFYIETKKFTILNDTTIILREYNNFKKHSKKMFDTLSFFKCDNKPVYSDILEKKIKSLK